MVRTEIGKRKRDKSLVIKKIVSCQLRKIIPSAKQNFFCVWLAWFSPQESRVWTHPIKDQILLIHWGQVLQKEEGFLGLSGSWGSRGLPRSTRTAGTHRGHFAQPALYPRRPPQILIPSGTMCKSTNDLFPHIVFAVTRTPKGMCLTVCRRVIRRPPPSQLTSSLHIWWLQQSRLWLEQAVYTFSSPVLY